MLIFRFLAKDYLGLWSILCYVLAGFGITGGWFIIQRGFRYVQASDEKSVLKDSRPIILYLRSFLDDPKKQRLVKYKIGPGQFVPDPRAEDMIAPFMSFIGPFVAARNPKDTLPQTGAYRLYIESKEWKKEVKKLILKSKLVIIQAGAISKSINWEIRECKNSLKPEQLIFFFPTNENRQMQYEIFRHNASVHFPHQFPEKIGPSVFLIFKKDWFPVFIKISAKKNDLIYAESLTKLVKRYDSNFVKPPFWKMVRKEKKWVLFSIWIALLVIIILNTIYGIKQIILIYE